MPLSRSDGGLQEMNAERIGIDAEQRDAKILDMRMR